MNRLRAWLWVAIATITMIPFALLSLVIGPLPFFRRYYIITRWTRLLLWLLRVICGIRVEVEGAEHLPQHAAVILSKHQSAWETFAFQAIFPPQVWVLKRELLRIPFFGWGLKALEPVAIDRSKGRQAGSQLLEQGAERLSRGIWVVIFPEGTRAAVGEHKRFKTGGARLAAHTGAPVVPVAHNAGLVWPRRSAPARPGVITVSIGPVIDSRGRSAEDINAEAEAWIEARTRELEAKASGALA
jgi:1-acyl-sn-glycerol-3-phosphate acyltransferase